MKLRDRLAEAERAGYFTAAIGGGVRAWRRRCRAFYAPEVIVRPTASGHATLWWSTLAMTRDRWDPDLTDAASARIEAAVDAAVRRGRRGAQSVLFAYGQAGDVEGLTLADAHAVARLLVVTFADPASWRSLTGPESLEGRPTGPPLRFDWVSDEVRASLAAVGAAVAAGAGEG